MGHPVFKTKGVHDDSWSYTGISAVCLALARLSKTLRSHLIDPELLYWTWDTCLSLGSQSLQSCPTLCDPVDQP